MPRLIPPDAQALIDAYTAGVNACIALGHYPMEITLLRYQPEPWTVVDSLSWGKMMAWTLSANWEAELLRAQLIARLGPEMAAELEPDTSADEPYIIPPGTDYSTIGIPLLNGLKQPVLLLDQLPRKGWAATIGCSPVHILRLVNPSWRMICTCSWVSLPSGTKITWLVVT